MLRKQHGGLPQASVCYGWALLIWGEGNGEEKEAEKETEQIEPERYIGTHGCIHGQVRTQKGRGEKEVMEEHNLFNQFCEDTITAIKELIEDNEENLQDKRLGEKRRAYLEGLSSGMRLVSGMMKCAMKEGTLKRR